MESRIFKTKRVFYHKPDGRTHVWIRDEANPGRGRVYVETLQGWWALCPELTLASLTPENGFYEVLQADFHRKTEEPTTLRRREITLWDVFFGGLIILAGIVFLGIVVQLVNGGING